MENFLVEIIAKKLFGRSKKTINNTKARRHKAQIVGRYGMGVDSGARMNKCIPRHSGY